MNDEILIYSDVQTNRSNYIFSYLLTELLGLKIHYSKSLEEANSYNRAKIYYTEKDIENQLCIKPAGLLSESKISARTINTGVWDGLTVLFADEADRHVPFDIFSASFWMMSRYEEYLPYSHDHYGRFPARESLAFKTGFLDLPVVNLWTNKLGEVLRSFYPNLKTKKNRFHWMCSIDIDNAWKYRNRGFYRTIGGLANSLVFGHDFRKRMKVLNGEEPDPYYTFDAIREIHREFPHKLLIFALSGKPGLHDPNNPPKNTEWKSLVNTLSVEYQLGIHPSFRSNQGFKILNKEFDTLTGISSHPLKNSRQHFLKIKLPHTYRNLIKLGIQNDFSMGYPGQPGFRAGVCTPFYFYDLGEEQRTHLKVWPITLMDRTLKDYLHKVPEESMDIINNYVSIVEKAGGWFIPIWHNDSLSNYGEWEGWKEVYVQMLETLKSKS